MALDRATLERLEVSKGVVFVLVTGALLFLTLRRSFGKLVHAKAQAVIARQAIELALESADAAVWTWDTKTDAVSWPGNFLSDSVLPPSANVRTLEDVLIQIHPEDREAARDALRSRAGDQQRHRLEYRMITAENEVCWIEDRGRFVVDPRSGHVVLVGVKIDVTQRKETESVVLELTEGLERKVQERTLQLKIANDELESFSYTVAHDLRAPLRGIHGFSRLLEKEVPTLSSDGLEYVQRIRLAAERMSSLIEDLLCLARIGQQPIRRERADVTEMAHSVLTSLAIAEPGRNVLGCIEPGLTVHGDPSLLRVVFENVLGNAWKFTSTESEPRIDVFRAVIENKPAIVVRDNGVGFDPAKAENAFEPFRRLHSDQQFPGTGIGLASVARIVARHGGSVWIETAKDVGTSVFINL